MNDFLLSKLNATPNSYFVDLNLCLSRIGAQNFYDLRYWHIGRAPYRREALREIAFEDFKFIRPLKGKNKKCLVVDCDNSLWGGIIGEDGLSGIKLGKTYPGSSYYELQQEIVNLNNRGIIIAICSKNNEPDVWEVFQKHPDMVLSKEHIATSQINWEDKATNLCKIADDLNIGLESIVFMDDSEFEINLIRKMLPEVETLHLPKDKAVQYRDILASCGLFDTLTVSEEDKKRGAMYNAEEKRKKLQREITDLESYYKSLEMVVEIRRADDYSIPRIAQLTQKTNQFNCTTRRYSEADISELARSENADVISLRLKDRFGDSGTVGVCILRYASGQATIDTLLLSCRVLGRGVDEALLVQSLKLAKSRGNRVAIGEYFETKKNHQVKNFYAEHGFKKVVETDEVSRFSIALDSFCRKEPDFFKLIDSDIDKFKGE
jgi:FkbH-like protein